MVEQKAEFSIKKETMIKKNLHDIKEVYEMESSVTYFPQLSLETWKWLLRCSAQSHSQNFPKGESDQSHCQEQN